MDREDASALFQEEQQFRQPWIWALLLPLAVGSIGVFAHALYTQLIRGRPWGDQPISDLALVLWSLGTFLLWGGLLWMLYAARLTIRLDERRLTLHFFPFRRRTIPLEEIAEWEARAYHPIREYGGWGIKYGGPGVGWVYNVRGDQGIQLVLTNGKRLLIGTQRPEAFAAALALVRPR